MVKIENIDDVKTNADFRVHLGARSRHTWEEDDIFIRGAGKDGEGVK